MNQQTVLVTGATGFIGQHLIQYLLAQHYQVIGLTRQKNKASNHQKLSWVSSFEQIKSNNIDYVVNLAGESIGQARWTDHRKKQLIESRVNMTHCLYQWLAQANIFPKLIISGSAIGFYGIDPLEKWQDECDENSPSQPIFMSELCQQWEKAALSYITQNTKIIRLGVVFGQGGGILPKMLRPIKLNAVGKIGSGHQPITWVHIDDVIRTIQFLFKSSSIQKIYNVVAPDHIHQLQFVEIAANILKRKPMLPLPSFMMRLMMGEQSQLVLNGQYVRPQALQREGFDFKYPNLSIALQQILAIDR
ncbi:TIGR01777 family oxidoreductase [Acinetobacter sp. ANC 4648]|uniref:TIGR01777 family oxidoreductase n=1 Tax=Acinetobacter sp. ANC 4648 TaxID=1977875 RepID=UPI000A347839|nr:TIGR01777 family oxidoreductase [Acinetobacter sp. ANC 4648]OTG81188.1 TIGR01777 family protein [Acinetobacter sp. ANC 4648]